MVDLGSTKHPDMLAAQLPLSAAVSPCQLGVDAQMPGKLIREKPEDVLPDGSLVMVGGKTKGVEVQGILEHMGYNSSAVHAKLLQLYLTVTPWVAYQAPLLQASVLECVAMPSSRGSS